MNFFLLTNSKSSKSQLQRPASHIAWWFRVYHNFIYILFQKDFHVINNFFFNFPQINFCVTLISFFHFFLFFWYHQLSGITQISYNFLTFIYITDFAHEIRTVNLFSWLFLFFLFLFYFWANWHIYESRSLTQLLLNVQHTKRARFYFLQFISRTAIATKLDSGKCEIYGNAMLVLLLKVATLYFNVQSIIRTFISASLNNFFVLYPNRNTFNSCNLHSNCSLHAVIWH